MFWTFTYNSDNIPSLPSTQVSCGAPGHTPLSSAKGLLAQLSPRQAKGCSRFSRENHNSSNNSNSNTACKRHKVYIFHGKHCQRRKKTVPQEYFIWPHKILVHGHNFVESLGQTGVGMPLPVSTCAEMLVDLGDAREKQQCELCHAIQIGSTC